ncbi:MAG TPA: hydroxymethylbilane synthase [Solirubrobacteraceae bacterium]|jgi:hydroxymethylbilane synthase
MRLGTRGSVLALAQARFVAELLDDAEIVTITVSGDRQVAPGEKSRWVDAIEDALLAGEIDLAVHSAKDMPATLADGLELLGAPERAAAEDVLCTRVALGAVDGHGPQDADVHALPTGARLGTSSVRRAAQLRAAREDVEIVPVSGNVDTRLRKLAEGDLDGVVLARAGLQRLGREAEVTVMLDPERFVPSPGQGTLALQGRADDAQTRSVAEAITHERTYACLRAERALAVALGASCNTPLGAHAVDAGCGCLHLRAWIGLPDGSQWIADELLGGFYEPEQLGRRMAERLQSVGVEELLRSAEEMAIDRA